MPEAERYDGADAATLARRWGCPEVRIYEEVPSTMDVAHELGVSGAAAGTVVLTDAQVQGRGRMGRQWLSGRGAGIWLTLLERPGDPAALDVLSLRIGLAAAAVLDGFADDSVRLKWPNDLFLPSGKVGGILIEARWREGAPEWVAIGLGINVHRPIDMPTATALASGTDRLTVLEALVPACRGAAARRGALSPTEMDEFARRDLARGRVCREPARGVVRGVAATGELIVATDRGETLCRSGSLILESDA